MLGPLINALTPYLPGIMELPEAHGAFAWGLAKGRIHKYIKRVPKPGGGYRYYYSAAHGGTVAHVEHFVEGASFKDPEGHWHIKSKDGDTLHLRHDETGEERKMTHAQLAEHLTSLHGASIKQAREAAAAALAEARGAGASKKQIARLEERAKRLGVDVLKESQRAAFSEHKRTTGEFHPWDPAERTPPKANTAVRTTNPPRQGDGVTWTTQDGHVMHGVLIRTNADGSAKVNIGVGSMSVTEPLHASSRKATPVRGLRGIHAMQSLRMMFGEQTEIGSIAAALAYQIESGNRKLSQDVERIVEHGSAADQWKLVRAIQATSRDPFSWSQVRHDADLAVSGSAFTKSRPKSDSL